MRFTTKPGELRHGSKGSKTGSDQGGQVAAFVSRGKRNYFTEFAVAYCNGGLTNENAGLPSRGTVAVEAIDNDDHGIQKQESK